MLIPKELVVYNLPAEQYWTNEHTNSVLRHYVEKYSELRMTSTGKLFTFYDSAGKQATFKVGKFWCRIGFSLFVNTIYVHLDYIGRTTITKRIEINFAHLLDPDQGFGPLEKLSTTQNPGQEA